MVRAVCFNGKSDIDGDLLKAKSNACKNRFAATERSIYEKSRYPLSLLFVPGLYDDSRLYHLRTNIQIL